MSEKTVSSVFAKYNTDKNESFHNYGKYYEKYLSEYRDKPLRYLEIGIWKGESLKAMREYFGNAEKIIGIDINPETTKYRDASQNIFVEIGDQSDANFLKHIHDLYGPFDVILDDGSHLEKDIVASFKTLFPLLKDGGLYVVEDSICIRNEMSYFHALTKHKNKWRLDQTPPSDVCVDPAKIQIKTSDPMEYSMGDIIFTNSAILLYKDVKHHWIV